MTKIRSKMHKFKYINSESSLDSDAEDYFGFPKKKQFNRNK